MLSFSLSKTLLAKTLLIYRLDMLCNVFKQIFLLNLFLNPCKKFITISRFHLIDYSEKLISVNYRFLMFT